MHSIVVLISDPWFWITVFVSVVGAFVVLWGLKIGADAEKLIPPADFKKDIFADIVKQYKTKMDFGHKIVMIGVAIEAICAFAVCVISGIENAGLKQESSIALQNAARAQLQVASLTNETLKLSVELESMRSNNLILQTNVWALEAKNADRTVTLQEFNSFMKSIQSAGQGKAVMFGIRHSDRETRQYESKVADLLNMAGLKITSAMNYPDNLIVFNQNSSIALLVDKSSDAPSYATNLFNAFSAANMFPTWVTNDTSRTYSPTEGHPNAGDILILVGEKP